MQHKVQTSRCELEEADMCDLWEKPQLIPEGTSCHSEQKTCRSEGCIWRCYRLRNAQRKGSQAWLSGSLLTKQMQIFSRTGRRAFIFNLSQVKKTANTLEKNQYLFLILHPSWCIHLIRLASYAKVSITNMLVWATRLFFPLPIKNQVQASFPSVRKNRLTPKVCSIFFLNYIGNRNLVDMNPTMASATSTCAPLVTSHHPQNTGFFLWERCWGTGVFILSLMTTAAAVAQ